MARAAVQGVSGVLSTNVDMSAHTVTVRLADGGKLDDVIKALNAAGYMVGTPKPVEAGK